MAIAVDRADLGGASLGASSGQSSLGFSTNATVASSGFIVVVVGWFPEGTTMSSVSGGGLSWAVDRQGQNPTGATSGFGVASAQAPSGLASSTTLTANFSAANVSGAAISGMSFTGVKTSAAAEATDSMQGHLTNTVWTTGSVAISAGSVLVGAAYNEATTSSTITGPSLESGEHFDATFAYGVTSGYRVESSAGSYVVAGTFGAGQPWVATGVAYLEEPTGSPAAAPSMHVVQGAERMA